MGVGLEVTIAALVGYFAMTCSPIEGVLLERFTRCVVNIARSPYNPLWIAGGIVFGPVYRLLGQRWRVERSWINAALVICALCLKPLAHLAVNLLSPPPVVWGAEAAIGV